MSTRSIQVRPMHCQPVSIQKAESNYLKLLFEIIQELTAFVMNEDLKIIDGREVG